MIATPTLTETIPRFNKLAVLAPLHSLFGVGDVSLAAGMEGFEQDSSVTCA